MKTNATALRMCARVRACVARTYVRMSVCLSRMRSGHQHSAQYNTNTRTPARRPPLFPRVSSINCFFLNGKTMESVSFTWLIIVNKKPRTVRRWRHKARYVFDHHVGMPTWSVATGNRNMFKSAIVKRCDSRVISCDIATRWEISAFSCFSVNFTAPFGEA